MDSGPTHSEGSRNNARPSQAPSIVSASEVDQHSNLDNQVQEPSIDSTSEVDQVSNPNNQAQETSIIFVSEVDQVLNPSNKVQESSIVSASEDDHGSNLNNQAQEPSIVSASEVDQDSNPNNQAPRIQKVEEAILLVQENAYLPCRVAIGPLNRERGMDMKDEKQQCLEYLLDRFRPTTHQCMVTELRQKRTTGNGFYHLNEMSEDDFLNMLVQDGCYILAQFLDMEAIKSSSPDVAVTDLKGFRIPDPGVVRDVLYLFENQMPFDVLETLYEKLVGEEKAKTLKLRKLMFDWVCGELQWLNYIKPSQQDVLDWAQREPHWQHLLGLVHKIITGSVPLLPATTPPEEGSRLNNSGTANVISFPARSAKWHRATYYDDYAFVSFVHCPLDGIRVRSILDVNLGRCGRLEIPPLTIYNDTLPMLLNLMVLERSYDNQGKGNHVTSYCFFLSRLAREVQDVALLSRRWIIDNNLQNDIVAATIISKITSGFSPNLPEYNYLQKTAEALDSRFRSCIYQAISWLKLNKLRNPAMAAVSFGGIAIFVFTIVQAVYAIKAYKKGF